MVHPLYRERKTKDNLNITLTATFSCRAQRRLPKPSPSGGVRGTGECEVLRTEATAAMVGVIGASLGAIGGNTQVAM